MNTWKLTREVGRIAVLGVVIGVGGCAHAPVAKETSIIDVIDKQRQAQGPSSCAAMNATPVCERSTRLDGSPDCRCVETRALTGAGAFRF